MVSAVALGLSLAGLYAVMSFTVSRRTREIGVRVALGAPTVRLVGEIFRGPLAQVAAGVVAGCGIVGGLLWNVTGGVTVGDGVRLMLLGAVLAAVCVLACIGPTRRVLRVAPTDALRAAE
jgi:ABC-type antimicrobial peptide transport system permease subunit